MECKDHVRSRENSSGDRRNEVFYRLDILGISESRWTGSGQRSLATGERMLFSGHEEEDAPHTYGVALMSKTAQRALIGWGAHGLV